MCIRDSLLAGVLTFDGAIGTRSEIVDGVYTGRLDGPFTYREGKATAMRELAAADQPGAVRRAAEVHRARALHQGLVEIEESGAAAAVGAGLRRATRR